MTAIYPPGMQPQMRLNPRMFGYNPFGGYQGFSGGAPTGQYTGFSGGAPTGQYTGFSGGAPAPTGPTFSGAMPRPGYQTFPGYSPFQPPAYNWPMPFPGMGGGVPGPVTGGPSYPPGGGPTFSGGDFAGHERQNDRGFSGGMPGGGNGLSPGRSQVLSIAGALAPGPFGFGIGALNAGLGGWAGQQQMDAMSRFTGSPMNMGFRDMLQSGFGFGGSPYAGGLGGYGNMGVGGYTGMQNMMDPGVMGALRAMMGGYMNNNFGAGGGNQGNRSGYDGRDMSRGVDPGHDIGGGYAR